MLRSGIGTLVSRMGRSTSPGRDGASNPSGQADQDVYLKALMAAGSVDHIEYGTYVARVKMAPLTTKDHGP